MTEAPVRPAAGWVPEPWTVVSVRRDLEDTFTLEVEPVDGSARPVTQPGQFNMLYAFGVGEVPISVSGLPSATAGMRHTIRSVGAVTAALGACRDGDVIGLRGPFGTAWSIGPLLDEDEPADLLLVGGGLGMAPLAPVVELAAREHVNFGRMTLLTGTRSPGQLLYADRFDHWRGSGVDVRPIVDHGDETWTGPIGAVTRLLADAVVDPARTFAMVCGPEVMMRFVGYQLTDLGVPAGRIEVSLERNMACGMGLCGHCQLSSLLLCRDGPVVRWPAVEPFLRVPEL